MVQILFKNAGLLDPRGDAIRGGASVLLEGENLSVIMKAGRFHKNRLA